ncbi:hypothetical protein BaRGS_00031988 [Batillaria attramentaria]|uniref:Thioredoxin domain-containing protein n=1 Tax=Batillaria attramentaria TaxID=370345 RepID=A0ABD0JPV5_9CAEN|nr:hypothetical protein BaRGS_026892 [Batillaria attramentaria]
MSGLKDLFGEEVIGKGGSKVSVDSLAQNDLIGIYFSAHWCGPCRYFTPKLAEFYNKVKAAGKKFEVIFVSSDQDEASFNNYYGQMPWLTVGFGNDKGDSLSDRYEVTGIPTLVFVDKHGKEKDRDGRDRVDEDPNGFPWDLA